jgi:serine phosphatase RsbU (regulator of sigma subunit)
MSSLDFSRAIRTAHAADPASVPDVVLKIAAGVGATDVVVYLVDFAQQTLEPLPTRRTHADLPHGEPVGSTMAGRAFVECVALVADRPDGQRIWVPIIEGSDRTGVLAVTVPEATEAIVAACEELGLFAGYLIATQARSTDLYNLHRRRRALSLAASMQWDLLPPLVLKTSRMSVAGLLEPAYDVGGDCFDYALNDTTFDMGIFDPVGHGTQSALLAALCVGSYRHDRRESAGLEQMHQNLDGALADQFTDVVFATGQLARIDLGDGEVRLTNAGHPQPMLIRQGQVVGELDCPPTLPWGLGALGAGGVPSASAALEPGDGLLFYTDGVVESHVPGGEPFGVDRLADLVGQHASEDAAPEEVLRRLVRAVLEHQDDALADDATIVLFQWAGPE